MSTQPFRLQSAPPPRLAACGRGATPQVYESETIDTPNPMGQRKLTYRFRPLRDWTSQEVSFARIVARRYFAELGGFRIVTDLLMRNIIQCLRDPDLGFENLIRAILARRQDPSVFMCDGSLRIGKQQFIADPVNFFADNQVFKWLQRSPTYQAAQRDQVADQRRDVKRTAEQEQARRAADFWQRLSDERKAQADKAGAGLARSTLEQYRIDPASAEGQGAIRAQAQRWAFEKWGPRA